MPKLHEKEIVRLDPNEVAVLLDQVEDGSKLTKNQLRFHEKTKIRDLAPLTLLLGTGIRVSECVGLNIQDVDFDNMGIKVRRKGGYEDVVYFGEEVESALLAYLEERKHIVPLSGHEEALFLSIQDRRITVRAVEKLVKKYASLVTGLKKSPLINSEVHMVQLYTRKRVIFILWRMSSDIKMSILPESIMRQCRMPINGSANRTVRLREDVNPK